MKTLKNTSVITLLLILTATSCHHETVTQKNCEGDNTTVLKTFYSEEFSSVPCNLQNIESGNKEVNLVITKQEDLEKYFTCHEQLPKIDFDAYFILAGRYTHNNCAVFASQQVLICNNRIIYKVRMLRQDCTAITSVFYATVIEKKYNTLPVDFDVQFKN